MKQISQILFTLLLVSCQQDVLSDRILTNREGILKIVVCSRGCYQYVLSTPELSGSLFPVNLDKTVQQAAYEHYIANQGNGVPGFPVTFSGILQDDSTVISVPAPNDAPIPRFKARNIELTVIREK